MLGQVYFTVTTKEIWFSLHWSHVCLATDSALGTVTLVADGALLQEQVYQEVLQEDENRPSVLNLT